MTCAIRELLWNLLTGSPAALNDASISGATWWPEVRRRWNRCMQDGLVEIPTDTMAVTELGRAFLRRIGFAFDQLPRAVRTRFRDVIAQ